ncbi:GAF and ANTAR domain-containing protein [Solirubrobacter sp. CPCC 204708]|uniref:GAF and ANTAR domain-containing protein n=1 Tax=Solirubrobacter deserti TaxID=2282478 RepID=A0ABT4RCJ9_9ACTN|nr:GAF and ANTAR domain-containing protein [Solirubrobacter deserti]MBE2315611.1 GAF and ANTAR domain-containing protein [Solirubrobacter deserti]MDA0136250.1 GAF and ANTAR domain-containing protein [Solirubrobacter deserti]
METAAELHRTLRELEELEGETPILEAIQQAVNSAAALFNVAGCGVMFLDAGQVLHYAASSDGHGRELERAQVRAGTGPCVQSLVTDHIVKTEDVTADERWPEIHEDLSATRVRGVLGVPLHIGGAVAGSLDAYCDSPHRWDDHEVEGLLAYAALIERLLLTAMRAQRNEKTVKQLEHALEHRVVIERAVGVLMERHRLDQLAAFERLRSAARDSRRRAADVAADILASVSPGEQ